MTAASDKLVAIVEQEFTRSVHKRLLSYARFCLSMKSFYGIPWQPGHPVPGGVEEEDLVHAAVEKFLAGERVWESSRVSFCGFLMGAIRSLSNNLVESAENRNTLTVPSDLDEPNVVHAETAHNWLGTENARAKRDDDKSFKAALFDDVVADSDLLAVAEGIIEDKPPRQIADEMGLNSDQVQNLKKKLVRKAVAVRERLRTELHT